MIATDNGITHLQLAQSIKEESPNLITQNASIQLKEYFAGNLKRFDLPLIPAGTQFQQRVWAELEDIPYGRTVSYKELSISLGNLKAIRAVGAANGKNPIPIIIPCHRVIASNGKLQGFALGLSMKQELLDLEKGCSQMSFAF